MNPMITSHLHLAVAVLSLTLFFGSAGLSRAEDPRPVVDEATVPKESAGNPALPTVFVVGDSTLKSNAPMRGWGQEIGRFFDPKKINVINRAIGGRSSRTFQNEGRWDSVLAEVKPGDFILVQFGHNDVGRFDDPAAKGRPSLHGEGEETAEVARADGSKEAVHTFGYYMRKYANDGKAKGAKVILCSMVPHKSWSGDKVNRGERETFVQWTANAAKAGGAAFVNLNEIVAGEYETLGPAAVESLFADKGTHTSPAGAELNARCVVGGLRALSGAPLDRYLSQKGKEAQPVQKYLTTDAP